MLPIHFELGEPSIYHGPEACSFLVQYTFTGSLKDILKASGLWTPAPGSGKYDLWAKSKGNMVNTLGAVPRLLPEDDVLLDLCSGQVEKLETGGAPNILRTIPDQSILTRCPDPDESWLYWDCRLRIEEHSNSLRTKPLPQRPLTVELKSRNKIDLTGGKGKLGGTPAKLQNDQQGYEQDDNGPKDKIQQRVTPSLALVLYGKAARACHAIAPPVLEKVGSLKAYPANVPPQNFFHTWQRAFALPVAFAVWSLRFILEDAPDQPVGPPPNT